MKKKSMLAAAFAATLAFGMMPAAAFAYDAEDSKDDTGDQQEFTQDASEGGDRTQSGNTSEVYVKTEARNISATIPLKIQVVGPAEGGDLYGTPSNYDLINNSAYPIRVVDVVAESVEGWELSTADLAAGDADKSTSDYGKLCLKLTPAGDGAETITVSDSGQEPGTGWVVNAREDEKTGTSKNLKVTGSISQINSVEEDATHAIDVSYTVAATTSDDK